MGFWTYIFLMIAYLASLSRESIVLASTLIAFLANNIWFTRALARLDITGLVDRAFRVTVAGLELKPSSLEECKKPFKNYWRYTIGFWTYNSLLIAYLTSLCRESIMLASTLVTFLANNIWFTRALASLDIAVLVHRAFGVAFAGL